MSKEDYNVYNTFDINFVNYGELYKTPRDMEANSSELIGVGHSADKTALLSEVISP